MEVEGHVATRRNIEIKARCQDAVVVRDRLAKAGARHVGQDMQRDTYFVARQGRLKLREGSIENSLIAYRRKDETGPRLSDVRLYRGPDMSELREVLMASLAVDVVVEKIRDIYFLDNVKIHVDEVPPFGQFVEIEAIDRDGTVTLETLDGQCRHVMTLLGVDPRQLVHLSYSDMVRARRVAPRWSY